MKKKMRCPKNQTMVIMIAIWLVMTAVLVPCNSGSSQPAQAPASETVLQEDQPAIDGAALLEERCSVCHGAAKPKGAKKTPEQWEQTVTRMIGKGAKLTDAEKTVLVNYLAKTYGP